MGLDMVDVARRSRRSTNIADSLVTRDKLAPDCRESYDTKTICTTVVTLAPWLFAAYLASMGRDISILAMLIATLITLCIWWE